MVKIKKYRIAFYLKAKSKEVESLTFQKLLLERFVARYGRLSNSTIEYYSECDDSTHNLEPERDRLIQDVKNGKIDVVIVADVGRICSCGPAFDEILNLLEKSHVRFISVGDNLDLNGPFDLDRFREDLLEI
jgi:DNA invertase Pin-like site-specific DNA recombinase